MPSNHLAVTLRLGSLFVLASGCGAADRAAPLPSNMEIGKPDGISGDQQVGVAGTRLPDSLRVVVTHEDEPVEGVTVIWWTSEGSVKPTSVQTGPDGMAATTWTTLPIFAQQFALARVEGDGGPTARFTAIVTPDPEAPTTVHVLSDGGNRFEPAELTIDVGGTVYWYWPQEGAAHNIVADDGESPPPSGAPAVWPKWHSFRFTIPGVYRYHCSAHGGPGGIGMSGTITVEPRTSE
jgi:plastocyanin